MRDITQQMYEHAALGEFFTSDNYNSRVSDWRETAGADSVNLALAAVSATCRDGVCRSGNVSRC